MLRFLTPDSIGLRPLYLFSRTDNSTFAEILTYAKREVKEHIEWSKSWSYGQAFDIEPVFVSSDNKEFDSFEEAHKHDCTINVKARHRGLLPRVAYKYKWNEQWFRTDDENFCAIMDGAYKLAQIHEKKQHNLEKLRDTCKDINLSDLDKVAQKLAESDMWVDPPAECYMPIM